MGFKSSKIQTPSDMTSEVINTPDIEAWRNWQPEATPFQPAIMAQFGHAERAANETGYSGLPVVAQRRLRDLQMADLASAKSLALAQGATAERQRVDAMRAGQLQALADLTAKRRQSGYTTQIGPGWGQTVGALLGGAGAAATGMTGMRGAHG